MRSLCRAPIDFVLVVLDRVHGGVGGAQQTVFGGAVLRVKSHADAGRALEHVAPHVERAVEAVFQPGNDFICVDEAIVERDQRGEFVAAQPRQHIAAQQLAAHAQGRLLQVKISHMVAMRVVDQLEFVEVDENQSEDSVRLARFVDLQVDELLDCEAVGNIGEQVVLRAAAQIGVEPPGLDGQRGQPRPVVERYSLTIDRRRIRIERGKKRAKRRADTGMDARADDAQLIQLLRTISKRLSVGDLAPAWSISQRGGNHCRNLHRGSRRGAEIR